MKKLGKVLLVALVFFCSWFLLFLFIGVIGAFIYDGTNKVIGAIYGFSIICLPIIGATLLSSITFKKLFTKKSNVAFDSNSLGNANLPSNSAPANYRSTDIELRSIDLMDGHEFEYWCAGLLRSIGYTDVSVTRGSGDQGVDVLAQKEGIRYAIQCKCYSKDLGNSPVQEVHTGKALYHCQIGAVMTNRHFTKGAKEAAAATGVLLWDRDWITEQLQHRSIGVASPAVPADRPTSELLESIIEDFLGSGQVSISRIQQHFGLDYHYAAFIMQALEENDFVTPGNENTPREMKISAAQWSALKAARSKTKPPRDSYPEAVK